MKVSQVIDAIEQNGYKQIRGSYITWEDSLYSPRDKDHVVGACALGQAALNLGIGFTDIEGALNEVYLGSAGNLDEYIIELNDGAGLTCKQIAAEIRARFPEILNYDVNLEVGNWYDVREKDSASDF